MFLRVICCNISYKLDIGHAQNSESEQKKLLTIFFCAVQPINNSKKNKIIALDKVFTRILKASQILTRNVKVLHPEGQKTLQKSVT